MNADQTTTTTNTTAEAIQGLPMCAERIALNVPEQFIEAVRESQAITAAQSAMSDALSTDDSVVALPNEFKTHDLEKYQSTRRRMRGIFSTAYILPFAEYTKAYGDLGATVFVNAANMSARAVLDLGTTAHPGHADNTASLKLESTAAFAALTNLNARALRQATAAEFFEDWSNHAELSFFHDADPLTTKQAIAAIRSITIEQARKVDSEEQQLSASRTAFESVKASSKETLPTLIYFTTKPYPELQPRQFVLRLGVNTGDSTPTITMRVQNMEQHTEEMGAELVALISAHFGDGLPVLMGSYAKAD